MKVKFCLLGILMVFFSCKKQLDFPIPIKIEKPDFAGNVKVSSKKIASVILNQEAVLTDIGEKFILPIYQLPINKSIGNLPEPIPLKFNDNRIAEGIFQPNYNIYLYGNDFGRKRFLAITDQKNTRIEHFLDFHNFNESPKIKIEDEYFSFQEVNWAVKEKDILYVSHGHKTYAKTTSGQNAYISAIDLNNYKIIWTTKPLTCNSVNFLVVGDVIICGYGFTAELDYLYVLDKNTGDRIKTEKVDSMIKYLVYDKSKLHVETYQGENMYSLKITNLSPVIN